MSTHLRAFIGVCAAYGWTGGPRFQTRVQPMPSGRERRNADWPDPRHSYALPFQNIPRGRYAEIKTMHLVCKGRLRGFLYQDRLDYEAENEIFAVAEAGQEEFQLYKVSTVAGVSYQRPVRALYAPDATDPAEAVATDPTITVDGAPDAGWTFDHDRGIAIAPAPMTGGEVLRWSGPFSVWVRFAEDDLPWSIDNASRGEYITNGVVQLIEIPPPDEEASSA